MDAETEPWADEILQMFSVWKKGERAVRPIVLKSNDSLVKLVQDHTGLARIDDASIAAFLVEAVATANRRDGVRLSKHTHAARAAALAFLLIPEPSEEELQQIRLVNPESDLSPDRRPLRDVWSHMVYRRHRDPEFQGAVNERTGRNHRSSRGQDLVEALRVAIASGIEPEPRPQQAEGEALDSKAPRRRGSERLSRESPLEILEASPPQPRLTGHSDGVRRRITRVQVHAVLRAAKELNKALAPLALAVLGGVVVIAITWTWSLSNWNGPALAPEDPLDALTRSESLVDGYGPSLADQLKGAPGGLLLNPATHIDPGAGPSLFPPVDRGMSFVDVIGTDVYPQTAPGHYEIRVRVVASEVRGVDRSLNALSDVRLWLGLASAKSEPYPYVVWARVDSGETGPVWASTAVDVECNCTVTIDPGSVRLYSDELPNGVRLDGADIDTEGQLIGYEGKDGVMPVNHAMSVGGSVLIKATLIVAQRSY